MHLVGNNSSIPCNLLNYGLWVNLLFFPMCIYKHCFPPMLLAFAIKRCTKMPCPLPHNHYCCLLSSPTRLPHLLICTCLISSPIACPPSFVLCWYLLRFYFFIFAICYISLFVTPFWIVCVHIFVTCLIVFHLQLSVCPNHCIHCNTVFDY